MTHTPCPWTATQSVDFPDGQTVITNPKGTRIIAVIDQSDEVDKVNTCLIAAAPELLETLKDISVWLTAPATDKATIDYWKQKVSTVITKATGEK
jgi:hypothetical protein